MKSAIRQARRQHIVRWNVMSPDAPRRILGETDTSGCGNHATVRNYFSPPPKDHKHQFWHIASFRCNAMIRRLSEAKRTLASQPHERPSAPGAASGSVE